MKNFKIKKNHKNFTKDNGNYKDQDNKLQIKKHKKIQKLPKKQNIISMNNASGKVQVLYSLPMDLHIKV